MLVAVCAAAIVCTAQDVPVVRQGNTELGGFVGASYGLDQFRVMGGGNFSYAVTKWLMPYGEFSYFPGIERSKTQTDPNTNQPVNVKFSIPLSDFHGGVHIRVPIRESRVVPYGVFGMGVVHYYATQYTVVFKQGPLTPTAPAESDFAVNFGGGVRYYVNERFGVRMEAKVYKPTGALSGVFGKMEGGFFFLLK